MSEKVPEDTQSNVIYRNYNPVTRMPFSAVELAQNGDSATQIMKFVKDAENMRENLTRRYNDLVARLEQGDETLVGRNGGKNAFSDDWETIPEYSTKLLALKAQLDSRTMSQAKELTQQTKQ